MGKRVGPKPTSVVEELPPPAPEVQAGIDARRRIAELFYSRLAKMLEHSITLLEKKILQDPGYQASPADIVGIMKTLQTAEELMKSYSELREFIEKGYADLKKLEGGFFSLLSGQTPG